MKTQKVICYRLNDLLTLEQRKLVAPYMRATWTEMWHVLGCVDGFVAAPAAEMLIKLSRVTPQWNDWAADGARLEQGLYALAAKKGCKTVMGPARKVVRV